GGPRRSGGRAADRYPCVPPVGRFHPCQEEHSLYKQLFPPALLVAQGHDGSEAGGPGGGSRRRQAVIAANAELRERELVKLASLASAVAEALRRRGVKEPTASLSAEAGIVALKVAFERWVQEPSKRNLPRLVKEALC